MTLKEDIDKKNDAVKKAKSEVGSQSLEKRVRNLEILLGLREPEV